MATTTTIDGQPLELHGTLTAEPVAHPLTLKYAGDEPYYEAVSGFPSTLLVHLHAWSSNKEECLGWPQLYAIQNCVWVCPNFGGQNNHPEGAGHPAQMERIKRVIDKARAEYTTIERVILLGYSGGGYVSLMFLGTYPQMVDGFSVWLNIHSLQDWWNENPGHRAEIEACLGGPPAGREEQYLARSPKGVLAGVSGKAGYINSGALDTEVLPHHQAESFNMLAEKNAVTFRSFDGGHMFQVDVAVQQINTLI